MSNLLINRSSRGFASSSRGAGHDARITQRMNRVSQAHYYYPQSRREEISEKFSELTKQWLDETKLCSSASDMVLNEAYQRIIGLGPEVIPLILEELEYWPNHWFWALRSLTGQNPVAPEDRGDLLKMRDNWLEWGKQSGYL